MIEFALLFGLGFLTATLLVLLLAPAVHRRVVRYTENRLKATMPLSPQEVRAQKDMVRATYAAENARTSQKLASEREKAAGLRSRADMLSREAGRLASDNSELQMRMNAMNVEAAELRSQLRREDQHIEELKESLHATEEAKVAGGLALSEAKQRYRALALEHDSLKIDLATRETEIESLKFRVRDLREERESLREDVKSLSQRTKDAEARPTREEHKTLRLEDKLAREHGANADKDGVIERRQGEIARLKDKLKTATAELREAGKALKAAGIAVPVVARQPAATNDTMGYKQPNATSGTRKTNIMNIKDTESLSEEVRNRSVALAERLPRSRTPEQDAVLREEIADVAARMVALTAAREGASSPIHTILAGKAAKGTGNRLSLAERAADVMEESSEPG